MANRFQELYRLQPWLHIEGSPVIIEAGALLKDKTTDKVLAQIKIRNLENKVIKACKISIRAFEPNGTELEGLNDYPYMDLNAGLGQEFGSRIPIYLPSANTREMSVSVTETVFEDGSVWSSKPCTWPQVPFQEFISTVFPDEEMQKQYEYEVGPDCVFVPAVRDGLFQCTCGTQNLETAEYCYNCHRDFKTLSEKINPVYLTSRKDARLKEEEEERQAAEAAAREAAEQKQIANAEKRKKTKKILKIVIPIVLAVAILAALTPSVIKPAVDNLIAYKDAAALLEAGSYDEAKSAFEALGDYRDSPTMVLESQYRKAAALASNQQYEQAIELWRSLGNYSDSPSQIEAAEIAWKEEDYQAALSLMEAKEYIAASEAFDALGDYKDSPEKSAECLELKREADYQAALLAVSGGDYKTAIEGFKALGDYKDSSNLYISTSYTYACQLAESGDYKSAIEYFGNSKGYEDTDDLTTDAIYNYACQLLDSKKYEEAITQFGKCSGYKDTEKKLLDAKYGYVVEHKDHKNTKTYSYLTELVSAKYSGAKKIYDELYEWKVTVTAINNSEYSTASMSSVSRYDRVYYHFTVTGGTPGETTTIKFSGHMPGCSNSVGYLYDAYDGWEGYCGFYFVYGYTSGTSSVSFYDGNGNKIGSASETIY